MYRQDDILKLSTKTVACVVQQVCSHHQSLVVLEWFTNYECTDTLWSERKQHMVKHSGATLILSMICTVQCCLPPFSFSHAIFASLLCSFISLLSLHSCMHLFSPFILGYISPPPHSTSLLLSLHTLYLSSHSTFSCLLPFFSHHLFSGFLLAPCLLFHYPSTNLSSLLSLSLLSCSSVLFLLTSLTTPCFISPCCLLCFSLLLYLPHCACSCPLFLGLLLFHLSRRPLTFRSIVITFLRSFVTH